MTAEDAEAAHAKTKVAPGEFALSEELVAQHDVLLFTEGTREDMLRWNEFCRTRAETVVDAKGHEQVVPRAIKFIATQTLGAAGYMFSDFGPGFQCHDEDGEPPVVRHVRHITNAKEGVVHLLTEEEGGSSHHNLPESLHNGYVTFSEVDGMYAKDHSALRDVGLSINNAGPWKVKHNTRQVKRKQKDGSYKEETVFDPYSFRIGDTTQLSPYIGRGLVTQFKKPAPVNARSMAETLQQPLSGAVDAFSFNAIDGTKFFGGVQLHLALQAVWEYQSSHDGALPPVGDAAAADEVVAIAKRINAAFATVQRCAGAGSASAVDDVNEDVVRSYAMYAGAELQPMAAFFGGVAAQEIVKVCAKFKPVDQWFHYDAFEVLPAEHPADAAPLNTRYDHAVSVFGRAVQEKVQNQRTFMVGCGALGCEFLKNFAMMGLATGPSGQVVTTDNDRIEVSNLNRQFLFRHDNVGQPKSVAAAAAVTAMNPGIKVEAKEELVHEGSEATFNEDFWQSLDFVTNALDNVKARNYVDGRCVFFEKALFESGTMGTKANVQVVLPHKTISYSDGPKEKEEGIPMCTLRNFPSQIEHCIEWARAKFTDMFVQPFLQASKVTADPGAYVAALRSELDATTARGAKFSLLSKKRGEMKELRRVVDQAKAGVNFEECVAMAFDAFHTYFRDMIVSLTTKFPQDAVTSSGDKFWSGTKRFPDAAKFDAANPNHMLFVTAVANVYAAAYGVVPTPDADKNLLPEDHKQRDQEYIKSLIARLPVPEVTITDVTLDDDKKEDGDDDDDGGAGVEEAKADEPVDLDAQLAAEEKAMAEELEYFRSLTGHGFSLEPADFEKDQDMNFHIDFITSASNLRASNYQIAEASRHKCKMIAGKIIPAIATTTAAITGLVCLEMYKYVQGKDLPAFRDCNLNLAVNTFQFFEPTEVAVNKGGMDMASGMELVPYKEGGFTKWDKLVVREPGCTLQRLLDILKADHGLTVDWIECHEASQAEIGKPVFAGAGKTDKTLREIVDSKFGDLLAGRPFCRLVCSAENEAGEGVALPHVVCYL